MLIQAASDRPTETVYSVRALEDHSQRTLSEWLNDQHVPNPLEKNKLHCSVVCACSELPPQYIPDRRRVFIAPTTYRLGVIGPAFALFFECCDLERQWNEAIEQGVRMMYPTFVPHISLSYEVQADWDYSTLQPPDFSLVLAGEVVNKFDPQYAKRNWQHA